MSNETQEKPQVRIADVKEMLNKGKTRDQIAEHYGITKADCKRLFLHPSLKGLKTKVVKELPFEVIDEEGEVQAFDGVTEHFVTGATGSAPEGEEEE